ncbi:MAG: SBBP repeat-containing protein, partial [Casimicrobiaceae bacterium]
MSDFETPSRPVARPFGDAPAARAVGGCRVWRAMLRGLGPLLLAPALASATMAAGGGTPSLERVQERLGALALPWVENAGQWDPRAAWRAQSFAGSVWLTREGMLVHEFAGPRAADCGHERGEGRLRAPREAARACARAGGWVLTEQFVGGRVERIVGREALEGRVSYLVGEAERHATDLPAHAALELGEVFPGVQVRLRATQANVEKLYTVAPSRDPGVIRMRLAGTARLSLTREGALEARTDHGPIRFTRPVAFQFDAKNERREVAVGYRLVANACGRDCHEYGFALGEYDRSRPLVIDPLLQSTYAGGSGFDIASALAIDPVSGEVYVAGSTGSTDFPGTTGGAQTTFGGGTSEVFVARFDAELTKLYQSTYLGGSGADYADGLAIHPVSGEVYVAGSTNSSAFPGTAGGAQASFGGLYDAFVTRFNAKLTTQHQSTYLGGSANDDALALAIHPVSGEVYVAGSTNSSAFP